MRHEIAALGLAGGWLPWRERVLRVGLRPSGVWVGKTIEF